MCKKYTVLFKVYKCGECAFLERIESVTEGSVSYVCAFNESYTPLGRHKIWSGIPNWCPLDDCD